jgi:hypothetical protein
MRIGNPYVAGIYGFGTAILTSIVVSPAETGSTGEAINRSDCTWRGNVSEPTVAVKFAPPGTPVPPAAAGVPMAKTRKVELAASMVNETFEILGPAAEGDDVVHVLFAPTKVKVA